MAHIERLTRTDELKLDRLIRFLKNPVGANFVYAPAFDAAMILLVPPEVETVVHYLEGDEQMALLYDPETMEAVGLQIEGFARSFVPQHEALQHGVTREVARAAEAIFRHGRHPILSGAGD